MYYFVWKGKQYIGIVRYDTLSHRDNFSVLYFFIHVASKRILGCFFYMIHTQVRGKRMC